ncbi:MAG TPA: trypsin-like peptidase domain-containing protein [Tepidisphaeraceae bacterium]|nr:trypsin-like peptidase domain-containing protein [Tepidisphaeraceae bacterium]
MLNMKKFGTTFVIGAVSVAAWTTAAKLTGSSLAYAETAESPATTVDPKSIDAGAIAHAESLASAFRAVGKAIEPSVVKIDVTKTVTASASDNSDDPGELFRRFFPDKDGDGEGDLPDGFDFRMSPGGDRVELGEGSGVIMDVDGETGYILTNNHVAGDATKITVTLSDGRVVRNAKVVGTDPNTDLAVVQITAPNLTPARWGTSGNLERGDIVLAFGSPFGYEGSMTQGIVSALNRSPGIIQNNMSENLRSMSYEYFIQTDAAINPGNSGGPLVNLKGEVVGINTAIATRTGSSAGIGFSIPIDQAHFVYTALRTDGKVTRGWLGVSIGDVGDVDADLLATLGYNYAQGVFIASTDRNTPAWGKLQPNDIITAINGEKVESSRELRTRIATMKPGTEITLDVFREQKHVDVKVTLGTQPGETLASAGENSDQAKSEAPSLGMNLTTPSANQLKEFDIPAGTEGALIVEVKPNSKAALYGLKRGDVITKVNGKPVTSAEEAAKELKGKDLSPPGISLVIVNSEGQQAVFMVER